MWGTTEQITISGASNPNVNGTYTYGYSYSAYANTYINDNNSNIYLYCDDGGVDAAYGKTNIRNNGYNIYSKSETWYDIGGTNTWSVLDNNGQTISSETLSIEGIPVNEYES